MVPLFTLNTPDAPSSSCCTSSVLLRRHASVARTASLFRQGHLNVLSSHTHRVLSQLKDSTSAHVHTLAPLKASAATEAPASTEPGDVAPHPALTATTTKKKRKVYKPSAANIRSSRRQATVDVPVTPEFGRKYLVSLAKQGRDADFDREQCQLALEVTVQLIDKGESDSSADLSWLAWALGELCRQRKVNCNDPDVVQLLDLVESTAAQQLAGDEHVGSGTIWTPIDICQLLRGLTGVARQPSAQLLDGVLSAAEQQMGKFDERSVTSFVHSLAKLRVHMPDSLLQVTLQRATLLLHDMIPQQYSNIIWGLASLDDSLPRKFVRALVAAAEPKLGSATPQALTNIVWSLAVLDHNVSRAFLAAVCKAAEPQMENFNSQDYSNLMWGLAKLEYKPSESFLDEVVAGAASKLDRFTPQHATNFVWSLATLEYQLPTSFLEKVVTAVEPKLGRFGPQDFGNLLWAFARLEYKAPKEFIARVVKAALPLLPSFSPEGFMSVAWGLGQMGYKVPFVFVDKLRDAAQKRKAAFHPQTYRNLLLKLSEL